MEIKPLEISGVYEISLSPITDKRGFFMRTYDVGEFRASGLDRGWVQENHSRSSQKGIIRGLHFQFPPHAEAKLVRCIRGGIWDVFVDMRSKSPTFGQWGSLELTDENARMVFLPRGLAHGFCTLSEKSEVLYKVDNYYAPDHEGGILWNDPDINISWPVSDPVLSPKDERNMTFREFINQYQDLKI